MLLALAGYFRANAQGPPNRYVVVTFEERYHVSQHGAVRLLILPSYETTSMFWGIGDVAFGGGRVATRGRIVGHAGLRAG